MACAAALALGACHGRSHNAIAVTIIGDAKSPFVIGPRLPPAAQSIRAASIEGLVALDAEGRVVPAIADRWTVTNDGQSYIFRMRDGTWPDGSTITGESARAALRQALAALRGTALGLDLTGVEDIRAMAGRVIEVRLAQPMPDLLQLFAQPELGLVHRGRGAGPMAIRRDGNIATLTPIPPERRGLATMDGWAALSHPIALRAAPIEAALAGFTAGDTDVVLGGTFVDLPRTNRTVIGPYRARLDPVIGLFGLMITHADGLLATAQTREAIAMAIDRDALGAALAARGWAPTTRIVSPGAEGDTGLVTERWADLAIAGRQTLAQQRIAGWVAQNHRPAELRIALPKGPGADILFDRLTADLATIGIRISRVGDGAPADLRLVDIVARYPRALWFLDQLACLPDGRPCDADADALVARARGLPRPAPPAAPGGAPTAPAAASDSPAALLAHAETSLAQSNIFIPLGTPIRWSLIARARNGFAINRWGVHPLLPLALGLR